MLNHNKDCKCCRDTISNKILNSNSLFLSQITEDGVLNATSKLEGKFSAGYDAILEKLVKESIQIVMKPLTFIFNLT
jgi:hypothetical protein